MEADNSTVKQLVSKRLARLKFMQRAKIKDNVKKQEADKLGLATMDNSQWVTPGATNSQCKVIIEVDPQPYNTIGRLSFGDCNLVVEKLVEEIDMCNKMRTIASASIGKEEKQVVNTPQASATCIKHGNVEANDTENISLRKRHKVEKLTKIEATLMKANSSLVSRGGDNESNGHHQQHGTKQVNSRLDWRNL